MTRIHGHFHWFQTFLRIPIMRMKLKLMKKTSSHFCCFLDRKKRFCHVIRAFEKIATLFSVYVNDNAYHSFSFLSQGLLSHAFFFVFRLGVFIILVLS